MHRNTRSHKPELVPPLTNSEATIRRLAKGSSELPGPIPHSSTQPSSSTHEWVEVEQNLGGPIDNHPHSIPLLRRPRQEPSVEHPVVEEVYRGPSPTRNPIMASGVAPSGATPSGPPPVAGGAIPPGPIPPTIPPPITPLVQPRGLPIVVPAGLQAITVPPNLPVFRGTKDEDPATHVEQFVELLTACLETDHGYYLVWFPITLKDAAYEWYRNNPANSFATWDALQRAFLNEFRPEVGQSVALTALSSIRQGRE